MIERLNRRKVCRSFLNSYNEKQYPALFPRLIEIAILTLKRDYKKTIFTIEELEDIISYYSSSSKQFVEDAEEGGEINYSAPEVTRPENYQDSNTLCERYYYHGDGNNYLKDEIDKNYGNNFYDKYYYVPWSKHYRNAELYSKRLKNPEFSTQDRNIYPHWWWNQKERDPGGNISDQEESNDSEKEHKPRKKDALYPPRLEKMKKKRNKSQSIRYINYLTNPPVKIGGIRGTYNLTDQQLLQSQALSPSQMARTQTGFEQFPISQNPVVQSTIQQGLPLAQDVYQEMRISQQNPLAGGEDDEEFRRTGMTGKTGGIGFKTSARPGGGDATAMLRSGLTGEGDGYLGASGGMGSENFGSMTKTSLEKANGKNIKLISTSISYDKKGNPIGGEYKKTGKDLEEKGGSTELFYVDGKIERKTRGIRRKLNDRPPKEK